LWSFWIGFKTEELTHCWFCIIFKNYNPVIQPCTNLKIGTGLCSRSAPIVLGAESSRDRRYSTGLIYWDEFYLQTKKKKKKKNPRFFKENEDKKREKDYSKKEAEKKEKINGVIL